MDLPEGVYPRPALPRRGFTDHGLRDLVARGELTRARPGWYATRRADPDHMTAARRGGAVSCVSILRRHGIWLMPDTDGLHIRGARHFTHASFCRGFGGTQPVSKIEDPLPLALLYAARCLKTEEWIVAADSVLNQQQWSVDELTERMNDFVKVPVRVHELLAHCDPRSQSGTETLVRIRLRAEGFHVEVQPRVPNVGHTDLRVGRLIIECDSEEFHSTKTQRRIDRIRDRKAIIERQLPFRVDYDGVIRSWVIRFWSATLNDIKAVTLPRRHRVRRADGR